MKRKEFEKRIEEIEGILANAIEQIEEIREECEESLENLPENFQESGPGEIIQERIDGLNDWVDQIQTDYSG